MRKRYFSICGFTSKRNEGNISDVLFCAKCMLRANFRIVKDLNENFFVFFSFL